MVAYLIVRANVTDMEQYKEYMKLSPGIVAEHGGKFIVRGSDVLTLEGEEETNRIVVLEFPSREHAEAFYNSEEYQDAIKVRENAATAQFIVVDGVS